MLDKVVGVLLYTAITFVGLAALPYLLWRMWGKYYAKGRQGIYGL